MFYLLISKDLGDIQLPGAFRNKRVSMNYGNND